VTGIDLGFQSFDGIRIESDPRMSRRRSAGEMSQLAAEWLAAAEGRDEPFFLWLHYFDPHYPYVAPESYRGLFSEEEHREEGRVGYYIFHEKRSANYPLSERALQDIVLNYDREIVYTDDALRSLLETRLGGILGESMLIVTADHGESLGEHGIITHNDLYNSIVRVPLLIRLPGGRQGGRVVKQPVMLVDIFPTIVDLLGLQSPPPVRGLSLVPAMEGDEAAPHAGRTRIAEYGQPAIYAGSLKLIERENGAELFDLSRDPEERRNLAHALPEKGDELRARYAELKRLGPGTPAADESPLPEVTTQMREELKALGYMDD
jgi:arylsulfatase A-like enzyme